MKHIYIDIILYYIYRVWSWNISRCCCQVVGRPYWIILDELFLETVPTLSNATRFGLRLCTIASLLLNQPKLASLSTRWDLSSSLWKGNVLLFSSTCEFWSASASALSSDSSFFDVEFSAFHPLKQAPAATAAAMPATVAKAGSILSQWRSKWHVLELFSTGRSRSHHLPSPWFLGF